MMKRYVLTFVCVVLSFASSFAEDAMSVCCRDGRYYWSVPPSLLERDFLMTCRIEMAAAGNRSREDGYAGDLVNTAMYRFERNANRQLCLKKIVLTERSDSTNVIYPAYRKNNQQSIAMMFNYAVGSDGNYEMDVTDWLKSDTDLLFFSATVKGALRLGGLQRDKSEILTVRSYDRNIEIRVRNTYMLHGSGGNATYTLHTSFLLLPAKPMPIRFSNKGVGYFTLDYPNYDSDSYEIRKKQIIQRWRLTPSPEDMERYICGELVEPEHPIVFYIDPSTPKQWVRYMIQGVNDWQPAFEKAGFKNAIYAREAPSHEEDPDWSAEDIRYSVIDYKASGIANAFGKCLCDPRSGEIIQSRIHFHHSLLKKLQSWYFVQCAPFDSVARRLPLCEERMGRMIRMIIAHEVGHAIGLTHNFCGTSSFVVSQLRDAGFLGKNGHTTSIMDYTRLNYVIQPEDNVNPELVFPRIGVYDEWAVEWGYRLYPHLDDIGQETALLEKKADESIVNPSLRFGDEDLSADPRSQREDLGNDVLEATMLGIGNLQRDVRNLADWTAQDPELMASLYEEILGQYGNYLGHVTRYVGGVYETPDVRKVHGEPGAVVEKEKQQSAVDFILHHFIQDFPTWLFPEGMPNRSALSLQGKKEALIKQVFGGLLNRQLLLRLTDNMEDERLYSICNLFADLNKGVFDGAVSDVHKRMMENVYVSVLCRLYKERDLKYGTDLDAVLFYQLDGLHKMLKKRSTSKKCREKWHYAYLSALISDVLNIK